MAGDRPGSVDRSRCTWTTTRRRTSGQEEIGLPSNRIERMGEGDNFWPASAPSEGPDGVCGPCSEIFYHDNFGETVEIWNLVFTQFNRVGAPPDNLRPLAEPQHRHGHGAGADGRDVAGSVHELPHRHSAADRRRGGRGLRLHVRSASRRADGGSGASPTMCAPARSRCTRTCIPVRRRRSTSFGACCGGPCWMAVSWVSRNRFCTSSCRSSSR